MRDLNAVLNKGALYAWADSYPLYRAVEAIVATGVTFDAGPVVPGQPIPISWSLFTIFGTAWGQKTVTARIYLNQFNALLFTSPPTGFTAGAFGPEVPLQFSLILPPSNVANEIYRIGVKELRIDVTDDATGQVLSTTADLEVVADHSVGWQWIQAQGTIDSSAPTAQPIPFQLRYDFLINHSYQVYGRLTNLPNNPNVSISGSVILSETDYGTSNTRQIQSVGFNVGPGGHYDIIFNAITQNWTWLISGIWVRNFSEPLSKSYLYTVQYSYTDSFGNSYQSPASNSLIITVSVSDTKRAYADSALAALGVGLILAIFTFGAGLSAAQAIAGGLGSKALDPPFPDPRFRSQVALPVPDSALEVPDKSLQAILAVLRNAEHIYSLLEVIGDIENRFLGARLATDGRAAQVQSESFFAAQKTLRSATVQLTRANERAIRLLRADARFNQDQIEQTLRSWQRGGIPQSVLSALPGGEKLESLLSSDIVLGVAQDAPRALNLLTQSLCIAVREMLKRSLDTAYPSETQPKPTLKHKRKRTGPQRGKR